MQSSVGFTYIVDSQYAHSMYAHSMAICYPAAFARSNKMDILAAAMLDMLKLAS
jgi:hypothetical protein